MIKKSVVVLTIAGGLLVACGGSKKEDVKVVENTVPQVQPTKIGELKIAFYYEDSLKKHFDYFVQQEKIVTKRQKALQNELASKEEKMKLDYESYARRYQNNELSQVEIQGYETNLQQQQMEYQKYSQEAMARLEKETFDKLEVIRKKIEKFGEKYCKEHNIDILMVHGVGGQFNFINPSMNVTKEFTAYLNQNQDAIEKEIKKK